MRDSEDKYLREERLKDDLDIAKKKIELEAAILDRDARAIENRFDLEAKEQEVERLSVSKTWRECLPLHRSCTRIPESRGHQRTCWWHYA